MDGRLNSYAIKAANYLRTNYPNSQVEDIAGGNQIICEDTPQFTTGIRFLNVFSPSPNVNYEHAVNIVRGRI